MGEQQWVEHLRRALGRCAQTSADVPVGIGDDAAVLRPLHRSHHLVATVDMLVEGQHFLRRGPGAFRPEDIGWKALAVNLSDVAAMGARPLWALCSVGVPPDVGLAELERVYQGMAGLACRLGVRVVGGNLARTTQLVLDVTLLAEAQGVLTRGPARPGDRILVTGSLGAAAAALRLAEQPVALDAVSRRVLWRAQRRPVPRLVEGAALAGLPAGTVHALCDISDGLIADLRRLLGPHGAVLWRQALPIGPAVRRAAHALGVDPLPWVLGGGEDYELLLTCAARDEALVRRAVARAGGVDIHTIGEVRESGLYLAERPEAGEVPLGEVGWDPFRSTGGEERTY